MRVLLLLLLVVATPAWSGWIRIAVTDAAVHYIDPSTIQKVGDIRRVWAMQDMLQTGLDGVRSIMVLQEYDCAEERFRYLVASAHSRSMGAGRVLVEEYLDDEWNYLPPGADPPTIARIVCAR